MILDKKSILPEEIQKSGISVHEAFLPGDLGQLIYIHGIQNFADYGFNQFHEAYCAKIAAEFILEQNDKRSRAWLTKKSGKVVGSIFVVEIGVPASSRAPAAISRMKGFRFATHHEKQPRSFRSNVVLRLTRNSEAYPLDNSECIWMRPHDKLP